MKNCITSPCTFQLKYLKSFQKLRNYSGTPRQFWRIYLDTLVEVCEAKAGILALGRSQEGKIWKTVAFSPNTTPNNSYIQKLHNELNNTDFSTSKKIVQTIDKDSWSIIAIKVNTGSESENFIALFYTVKNIEFNLDEKLLILKYLYDIPLPYRTRKAAYESAIKLEQFTGILDLMVSLNEKEHYQSTALTFCNELAKRYQCDRVSLGWVKNKCIKLQAVSNNDNFDKKIDIVKKLELAMEESFEQNTEIVLPVTFNNKNITVDTEEFAHSQNTQYLYSIPLRIDDEPVAICTLEKNSSPFTEIDQQLSHISCDQVIKRLDDLKNSDRWIGALFIDKIKKFSNKMVGFNHTGAKLIGILVAILLIILCFIPVTYRLESAAILRTDDISFLTTPFNSHIDKVFGRVGDEVKKGTMLLILDKNELLLEASRLEAEKKRYQRDSEKARAVEELADMRIAEALKHQTLARLKLIHFQLNQVEIKAPFDGIIVEGDQMERVGAPVQQGDVLFKIAYIKNMYVEIEVPETEIHNLNTKLSGEIALACKPQNPYTIEVIRIEPAAVEKDEGNVFIVHSSFTQPIPKWWRPGMTGVSKLNAGRKTLLWIFTHKTIDFLRLKLWW